MKKKLNIVLALCLLGGVGSYNLLNVGAEDYEMEAGFISEDTNAQLSGGEEAEEFLQDQEPAENAGINTGNEEEFTGEFSETEERNTEEPDAFETENEISAQLQEQAVFEGSCGKDGTNLTWNLENDGTLQITGSGAMADWEDETSVPWNNVKDKIQKVIIDDTVTTIGSFAFYNCMQTTDIQMPENLEYVGSFAFCNCSGVAAVTIG